MAYATRHYDLIDVNQFKRNERIFRRDGQFYYHTRGSKLIGPFSSRSEARSHLAVYVELREIESAIESMTF